MRAKKIALVVAVLTMTAPLAGCLSSKVAKYAEVDFTDKSITVPPGNGPLIGEIKDKLRIAGWRMVVDRGPNRIEGSVGEKTQLESFNTFRTRYRLAVRAFQYDYCIIGSPAISYDLSVIDNKTGEEVIAQSGQDCESSATDKFMTAFNGKS